MALATIIAAPAAAQVPDTARTVARLDSVLVAARDPIDRDVWPGFDVKRIGLLYMIPNTGKLLARWPVDVAESAPLDDSRRWTTSPVSWSRMDAVQVVPVTASSNRAQVLGLALHEAFHVHQGHHAGQGSVSQMENAMLTPEYPLLDAENEAAAAAEAKLLLAAVEAPTTAEARRVLAQFLAVRRVRHARLDPLNPAKPCSRKSYAGSAARGPLAPKPDRAQQTIRGLISCRLA
jgi:hypothetical protein